MYISYTYKWHTNLIDHMIMTTFHEGHCSPFMLLRKGDHGAHWFMEGFQGSEIVAGMRWKWIVPFDVFWTLRFFRLGQFVCSSEWSTDLAPQEGEPVLWRQRMRRESSELGDDDLKAFLLRLQGIKTGMRRMQFNHVPIFAGCFIFLTKLSFYESWRNNWSVSI